MRMLEKVALVTGGAAGIGRATALRFAEEGGKVAICDLNEAAGMAVVAELGALGAEAMFHKVNVVDRGEVRDWVAAVVARFGRIDVLVNNAGHRARQPTGEGQGRRAGRRDGERPTLTWWWRSTSRASTTVRRP